MRMASLPRLHTLATGRVDRTYASSDSIFFFRTHQRTQAQESGMARWILMSYDFMNNDTRWIRVHTQAIRTHKEIN